MTRSTEATWRERVRAWKASGQTAEEFASGQGFAASTLKWRAYALVREAKRTRMELEPVARSTVPMVRVVRKKPTATTSSIVLEIGEVRVRVDYGFDRVLLRELVDALGGGR